MSRTFVCLILLATIVRAADSPGTWITTAPSPIFASEHNATVVADKIYVGGGFAGPDRNWTGTTNAFLVYDPATNAWTQLPPLPKKLHHFGIATLDNRIYVTGGYTDEDFELDNRSAYVFDPLAANGGSWTAIADLPVERAAHSSVAVDGLVYVVGGIGPSATALLTYNPATNSWSSNRAPLPTPREHLTAAVVNNRIYVISGRWSAGNVGTVEEYNPATNTWRARADIPTPRSGITSGVINGRIHVTAGEGHPSGISLASHEVYDPASDTWTAFPAMPTGRHGLASGVVHNRWYVIGGGLLEGGGTFNSLTNVVETFVPASSTNPPAEPGRIINVSVFSALSSPGDSLTMGFVVAGGSSENSKSVLVRAVGPSLTPLIGAGALDDPRFELFSGATRTNENDNWGGASSTASSMAAVGAFPFVAATSRDAALATSLPRGDHSVRISAANNGTGNVLAEVYEAPGSANASSPRLVNVSVLKATSPGLAVGFVIGGPGPRAVLIRAIGPTLGTAPFNLTGAAADPLLTLYAGSTRLAENNDWGGTGPLTAAFAQVAAFALPSASRDAALLATLTPGNYSAHVTAASGAPGLVLVEVYELP